MSTLLGTYAPQRGGHAPSHLREAFEAWVAADRPPAIEVGMDKTTVSARRLRGILWNCSDTMPSDLCAALDMPAGSSYAMAARQLI